MIPMQSTYRPTDGLGAYYETRYNQPIDGLGAYYETRYNQPIDGLGISPDGLGKGCVPCSMGQERPPFWTPTTIGVAAVGVAGVLGIYAILRSEHPG